MELNEFRHEMETYWKSVNDEAVLFKDQSIARNRLLTLYDRFDARERRWADQVLSEWVLSEKQAIRFDAMVLIEDRGIVGTLPALDQLTIRLASSHTPGAPDELPKVNRLLKRLSAFASRTEVAR